MALLFSSTLNNLNRICQQMQIWYIVGYEQNLLQ